MPFTHRGDSVGNPDSSHGGHVARERSQIMGLIDKESKGRYLRSTSSGARTKTGQRFRHWRGERMVNSALQGRAEIASTTTNDDNYVLAQYPSQYGKPMSEISVYGNQGVKNPTGVYPSAGRYKQMKGIN